MSYKAPQVSVIVPVYGCEQLIERCLKSILSQTVFDIEIILIDDGTPDCAGDICDHYSKRDSRCQVYHQKNQGIAYTRNRGLDLANGDYICFVDSDDYIEPNMIEKLLATNSDLTVCGYHIETLDENGTLIKKDCMEISSEVRYTRKALGKALELSTRLLYPLWNKLFRRSVIKKNGIRFESISMWEDACFVCDYLKVAETFSILSDPLYHYTVQRGKASLSKSGYTPDKCKFYFTLHDHVRSACKTLIHAGEVSDAYLQNDVRLIYNVSGDLLDNIPGHLTKTEEKDYIESINNELNKRGVSGSSRLSKSILIPTAKITYKLLIRSRWEKCIWLFRVYRNFYRMINKRR